MSLISIKLALNQINYKHWFLKNINWILYNSFSKDFNLTSFFSSHSFLNFYSNGLKVDLQKKYNEKILIINANPNSNSLSFEIEREYIIGAKHIALQLKHFI